MKQRLRKGERLKIAKLSGVSPRVVSAVMAFKYKDNHNIFKNAVIVVKERNASDEEIEKAVQNFKQLCK